MRRPAVLDAFTGVLALALLLPVLAGAAVSAARLASLPQPLPGFLGSAVNADALALYHGLGLYHNPTTGYVGSVYTPGVAMLASVLDRITLWSGWVPLICYVPSFVVAGMAGFLACRPPRAGRPLAIVEAAGFAAAAWLLLSALSNPSLYDGHIDHPAWALAFGGLLLVPAVARGSRAAFAATVLLFTLAIWVKQTAIAAPVAGVVWLALQGPPGPRCAVKLAAALLVINGVLAGILIAATDGWAWRILFAFGIHQPVAYSTGLIVREFLDDHALILLAGAVTWGILALPAWRARTARSEILDADVRAYAAVLGLFVVLAGILAFQARRVQGGQDNDYIPVTWGLLLLTGLAYGALSRRAGTQMARVAVLAALLGVTIWSTARSEPTLGGIHAPPLWFPAVNWGSPSPGIGPPVGYIRPRTYYDWTGTVLSHDGEGRVYPPFTGLLAGLAVGRYPAYFVNALLDRRFAALQTFPAGFAGDGIDAFASADGRYEQHFFWKLNQIIATHYVAVPGVPPGVLVRRSGPEPDRWMRSCLAPFTLDGVRFTIGLGGGFWCRKPDSSARIALVSTPSAWSEIHTQTPVATARGEVTVTLARGSAAVSLRQSPATGWEVRLNRLAELGPVAVDVYHGTAKLLHASIGAGSRNIPVFFYRASPGADAGWAKANAIGVAFAPLANPARLMFSATGESKAAFQLTHLRLR